MSLKSKLIAGALATLVVFGLGVWVGHDKIPQPTNPDPQKFFHTVHTPRQDGTQAYVEWADKRCRQSLRFAIYTLTDPIVVDEWIELKTVHHSDVQGVVDLSESRAVDAEKELLAKLDAAHIPYRIGHSPKGSGIMHNKYSACGGEWVQDGSWNYTTAANDQANTLNFNIVPSPLRYQDFRADWEYLWDDFGRQTDKRAARAARKHRP
jgi:hypothetical protein